VLKRIVGIVRIVTMTINLKSILYRYRYVYHSFINSCIRLFLQKHVQIKPVLFTLLKFFVRSAHHQLGWYYNKEPTTYRQTSAQQSQVTSHPPNNFVMPISQTSPGTLTMLLRSNSKVSRFSNCPISVGISPVKSFSDK